MTDGDIHKNVCVDITSVKYSSKSRVSVLFLILVLFVGLTTSEPVEPRILEYEDNFNNTYDLSEGVQSDQILVFGEEEILELCVSRIEHSENANLTFGLGVNPNNDDPCFEFELTPENYSDSFNAGLNVVDHSLPHEPMDMRSIRYSNTELATNNSFDRQLTTDYDHVLIEREKYESVQHENEELRDRNEDLESQLDSKNSTIESLENEIEDLEEELRDFRAGLTNWVNSIF